MSNPQINQGQQQDPNAGKKGYQAASISVPSAFEKYHKLILSIKPDADLIIRIQANGTVNLSVNGVLFSVDGEKYSLDQRILQAFKKAYTEYSTK